MNETAHIMFGTWKLMKFCQLSELQKWANMQQPDCSTIKIGKQTDNK